MPGNLGVTASAVDNGSTPTWPSKTALTLRLVFNLPFRQTEGLLNSILSLMNLALQSPDHTTLSRRRRTLDVALCPRPPDEAIHLVVDSTGLKIVGQGEWAAAKHGGLGKRGWRKLQSYASICPPLKYTARRRQAIRKQCSPPNPRALRRAPQ